MKQKPDKNTCYFGASTLKKNLEAFNQEIDGVRQAQDIEYIHRMRVASRRLRSALPLFASCFPVRKVADWTKHIRQITLALGNARDTDVQLNLLNLFHNELTDEKFGPGIRRLILRLTQKRVKLQVKVNQSLEQLEKSNILAGMISQLDKTLSPFTEPLPFSQPLYNLAYMAIDERLTEFLDFEEYIYFPERVAELHAMRIAAKRLRYVIEIFAPLFPDELKSYFQAARKTQDTLGDIHDCDVWSQFLPEFIERERQRVMGFYGNTRTFYHISNGISYFQQNCLERREQYYKDFLVDWQKWKTKKLWDDLRDVTRLPLLIVEQVYPPPSITDEPAMPEANP
jgi:CHAD domain-containing protein